MSIKKIEAQRSAYPNDVPIGNTKRRHLYDEFGYPYDLGFEQFYTLYNRNGLVGASVDMLIAGCWGAPPEIFEGAAVEDAKGDTEWDKKLSKLFKNLYPIIREADKRNLIGKYSALLIQVRDNRNWDEPIDTSVVKRQGEKALVRLIPVWEEQLKIKENDTDPHSENFGFPKMYTYSSKPVGGKDEVICSSVEVDVHPDRVITLSERSGDGLIESGASLLLKGYNAALDTEKIAGGAAEGYLKNASRQLALNFGENTSISELARAYNVKEEDVPEAIDGQIRALNRNVDAGIFMQDGSAQVMSVPLTDPMSAFTVSASIFCATLQIPTRMVLGHFSGERASTEDGKAFAKMCNARCRGFLTSVIETIVRRFWEIGIIEKPKNEEITVSWPDLLAPSQSERLNNAQIMAEVAKKTTEAFGRSAVKENEIRAAAELPTLDEYEEELEQDDEQGDPLNDEEETEESDTTAK